MQDKTPINENNQPHGYWEIYRTNGSLWFKENHINGERYGYRGVYDSKGEPQFKRYYAR